MARWWSNCGIDARLRLAAAAVAGACLLAGCSDDAAGPSGSSGADDESRGALPAPAGTPGASATGMPTRPPAPVVAPEPTVEPVTDPAAVAGDPAAVPVDPSAAPLPGDALAIEAAPATPDGMSTDATGAARAMTEYMAALSSGALAQAQQQWAAAPTDGAVIDAARSAAFAVDVGAAVADPARAAATVPVQIRAVAEDGTPRTISAVYTLQRGTGASWRIVAAAVRDGAP